MSDMRRLKKAAARAEADANDALAAGDRRTAIRHLGEAAQMHGEMASIYSRRSLRLVVLAVGIFAGSLLVHLIQAVT